MEYKMYIVIRKDLKLPKGKMAVQAAHAAVGLAMKMKETQEYKEWFNSGQGKVAVYADDEKHLLQLMQKSKDSGFKTYLVTDAGKTVVAPGTKTCFALGPDDEKKLEPLMGELKLV